MDEKDEVEQLYEHYKAHIQPLSKLCPRKKIAARLKRFSPDELRQGIDHFHADGWWMENNASRGADWFFESDQRSEQFLLMTPRPPGNGLQVVPRDTSALVARENQVHHFPRGEVMR